MILKPTPFAATQRRLGAFMTMAYIYFWYICQHRYVTSKLYHIPASQQYNLDICLFVCNNVPSRASIVHEHERFNIGIYSVHLTKLRKLLSRCIYFAASDIISRFCISSTSLPGGNQVDGLPPVASIYIYLIQFQEIVGSTCYIYDENFYV